MEKAQKRSVIKIRGVTLVTQISRSAIYELIKKGLFPKPIKLGVRASGWFESEIEQWLEEKAKQRDAGIIK